MTGEDIRREDPRQGMPEQDRSGAIHRIARFYERLQFLDQEAAEGIRAASLLGHAVRAGSGAGQEIDSPRRSPRWISHRYDIGGGHRAGGAKQPSGRAGQVIAAIEHVDDQCGLSGLNRGRAWRRDLDNEVAPHDRGIYR